MVHDKTEVFSVTYSIVNSIPRSHTQVRNIRTYYKDLNREDEAGIPPQSTIQGLFEPLGGLSSQCKYTITISQHL